MIKAYPDREIAWRVPLAFQVVFILLTWATIFFLPESPRYLYAQGYIEDGDAVMARLYDVAIDSEEVQRYRAEVFAVLEAERQVKFSVKQLFVNDSPVNTTWRLWLGVMVQFLQQMDGNNIVSYVGPVYPTWLFHLS